MLYPRLIKSIAVSATALAIAGGAYGILSATASDGSATATTATALTSGQPPSHNGGSNARSGPAAGGTVGTVDSVLTSSFILTTPTGQEVTVKKASPTTSVKKGKNVLVLGTVNGTTIMASKVIVQATSGSARSSAAGVVPFQQGAASTAKQVGQIPANYRQGSGTIVSGTAANKATEAALAAYPGGVVDRVVKLSNGEYDVHNIGVNWPHHIFVNQNFKVVGAD
jgi:cytochrome c-type biogenesis protein CcmE